MLASEIKRNLNKKVLYKDQRYLPKSKSMECILTGATIRKNKNGECYYNAELTSCCCDKHITIAPLDKIEKMEGE